MGLDNIILIVLVIWNIALTATLLWIFNYYKKLTHEVNKGNLIKVLDRVILNETRNSESIKKIKSEIKRLDTENLIHVQKQGLIRFNPFNELGGDHSFALCLLDGKNDGIILTGLHTRERTRVYLKQIKKGKTKLNLSTEENKALVKALSS
ncbi:hypothetical protein A2Z22_01570 [Candidatus Woesebacteria bacterium RBG_16_34_12]|uniref:DUF4446 domain-containing protein n=1 Tax=Candidatus Woesebacteria bacterium RBG_16_34_12 TaxID=1802480 RepID=A0A1F7XA52_9BACT|nr:MAG: hypothetical protein A2Z22_01570 [Candidatus Woesebacteria bacterium RBG_16_34_12]